MYVYNFPETAPLYRVDEIRMSKSLLPKQRGVYAWFFDQPPNEVPTEGCLQRDDMSLLYIGTAGADLRKNGNLHRRLGVSHLGGNERRSTLMQTFAAVMSELAGPAIAKVEPKGLKYHTSKIGEKALRDWMDLNTAICWIEHPAPAEVEAELIARYRTPLNIEFAAHPFAPLLSEKRNQRRKEAVPFIKATIEG